MEGRAPSAAHDAIDPNPPSLAWRFRNAPNPSASESVSRQKYAHGCLTSIFDSRKWRISKIQPLTPKYGCPKISYDASLSEVEKFFAIKTSS